MRMHRKEVLVDDVHCRILWETADERFWELLRVNSLA